MAIRTRVCTCTGMTARSLITRLEFILCICHLPLQFSSFTVHNSNFCMQHLQLRLGFLSLNIP